jgi:adhesin transport system outer membrane protein
MLSKYKKTYIHRWLTLVGLVCLSPLLVSAQEVLPVVVGNEQSMATAQPVALQFNGLRDLVLLVLSRHPELKKAEFESRGTSSRLDEARSARLPQLSMTGSYGHEKQKIDLTNRTNTYDNQYQLQLRLTQPLLDKSIVERVQQNRALSLGQDWHLIAVREQIMLSTVEMYAELIRQFHLTNLARDNLKQHRSYVGRMKDLARTDLGRASDLPVAEARVALAESVFANRLSRLESARVQWRNFSGLPAPEFRDANGTDWFVKDLTAVSVPATLDEALSDAHASNPQLQKALAEVKASWHALGLSLTATMPKISAEGRIQMGSNYAGVQRGQTTWYSGINLQWSLPVNSGFSHANRAARQSMKAAESSVDSAVFKLRAGVETQWYELLANQATLTAFQSYVTAAEQVVKSYSEQFKIGKRSLLDVLNAENELFSARSNVMTTQTDLSLASWRLLSQRGLMTQELSL